MAESYSKWVENTGKKRNCLFRAISPFPTVFWKGLFPRDVKRCHCVGMGYMCMLLCFLPCYLSMPILHRCFLDKLVTGVTLLYISGIILELHAWWSWSTDFNTTNEIVFESCSVKRGLNAFVKSMDPCQLLVSSTVGKGLSPLLPEDVSISIICENKLMSHTLGKASTASTRSVQLCQCQACIAQLVACRTWQQDIAGSIPGLPNIFS